MNPRPLRALLTALAAAGCVSGVPQVDPGSPLFAGKAPADLQVLADGRSAYIRKCSGCHPLYRPSRGDGAYWGHWVREMAARSHLSAAEEAQVVRYLEACAAPAPRAAPADPMRPAPAPGSGR